MIDRRVGDTAREPLLPTAKANVEIAMEKRKAVCIISVKSQVSRFQSQVASLKAQGIMSQTSGARKPLERDMELRLELGT